MSVLLSTLMTQSLSREQDDLGPIASFNLFKNLKNLLDKLLETIYIIVEVDDHHGEAYSIVCLARHVHHSLESLALHLDEVHLIL